MRTLDENNNVIENVVLEKGYLITETIVIAYHDAIKASQIKGIRTYESVPAVIKPKVKELLEQLELNDIVTE